MSDKKTPSQKLDAMNKNNDGLMNVYTREGTPNADKQTGYQYFSESKLKEAELRTIYRTDGFGKKIVDRPVEDMTRNWIEVKGDTDGDVNRSLLKLGAKKAIKRALTWAQVYGGGVIVMIIKDGGDLEEPLNESNIEKIDSLQVYDRHRITWTTADLYEEPTHEKYLTPEIYTITPIQGTSFKIHETRVLRFDGILTDDYTLSNNDSWSDSVYQAIRTHLINLNSAYQSTKSILDDFIQIIIQIENLQEMIAAGQEDLVKTRLNVIDQGRHIMNTILLDANENYTKEASTVSGLEKLIQEFQLAVSAVVDIPLTILMGRSPGGMNSTGESDLRMYYDSIKARQEEELLEPINRLVYLTMLSSQGPTKGAELEKWKVEFLPLWEPTAKEITETRKTQAETDQIYIQNQVVTPEEIAISRFSGDYTIETEIDEKATRETFSSPEQTNEDGEGIGVAGITSTDEDHNHEYMIIDSVSGRGQTNVAGGHVHRIKDFKVLPYTKADGTTHTHKLMKIK